MPRSLDPLRGELLVDWLDEKRTRGGRLGLCALPGRSDTGRDLAADVGALCRAGATHIVVLISCEEFVRYGVAELIGCYRAAGLGVYHQPIADRQTCGVVQMHAACRWVASRLESGARIVVHCVGGLGRSGTLAACCLKTLGEASEAAISEVRRARSPLAIETAAQEAFVRRYRGARSGLPGAP